MSTVIAERELDYFGDAQPGHGAIRVFVPTRDQNDWRCDYEIEWPSFRKARHTFGVDSWQALVLAMKIIPVEVSASDDFKLGRIGCFGEKIKTAEQLTDVLNLKGFGQ